MTRPAIALSGLGIVSAVGRGLEATLAALRAGASGLGPLTRFSSPRNGHHPVAEVLGVTRAPRTRALARVALEEALSAARLPYPRERIALVLGTCVGGMPESEDALAAHLAGSRFDPDVWRHHACGETTAALAEELELGGPALTLSNACSSGAQALASGSELLQLGLADAVVAGGADALCRLTLNGFAALLAMDPRGCRPFDRARGGMSLGEGAAFCVLERADDARARGAHAPVQLAGSANTCDAHHPTAPEPEGRGAEAAMRLALASAGLEPAAVDYVNAHGTGTRDNDSAEGKALARVFGARAPAISSTKGVFGHTLGAAGAIEAVVCALALTRELLPGTARLEEPDPECPVEVLRSSRPGRPRAALSNSFGFGGNNTVLVFRRAEDA
jgi:3-oxoacyl-(acyl-carrier-protein) synthase